MYRHHPWALLVALALVPACGASAPRTSTASTSAGLPITAGTRLFFEASREDGAREVTVAITGARPNFSYELTCGHVAAPQRLARASTGVVEAGTLANGRDTYGIDRCERAVEHDGAAMPAFLVSDRVARALEHRERTTLHVEHHESDVALLPVGHETISVRVDGRSTPIDTVHARGGGVDLWIAEGATPIVVQEREGPRSFTLAAIDTGAAR